MQHVAGQGMNTQLRAAGVQIDVAVGLANQLAEFRGRLFGDRTVPAAGTGSGQVQPVVRTTVPAPKRSLVDHRDQCHLASQPFDFGLMFCEQADEPPGSLNWLKLISMHASCNQQVRTIRPSGEIVLFHGNLTPNNPP